MIKSKGRTSLFKYILLQTLLGMSVSACTYVYIYMYAFMYEQVSI